MSTIETLMVTMIATVAAPIMAMLTPSTRIFFLYVGSAAILALLVYRRAQKKRREEDAGPSIGGFFHWCAPRRIYGHASARVDYRFYALSMMFYALGFIPIAVTAPSIAAGTNETLGLILGTNTASGNEPGLTIKALYTLSVLIAFDAGTFLAHLLVHKVPILWEFHKVHHSAQVLTPITAYRSHPVDVMVAGAFVATTTGIVGGAFAWANAARVDEMLVLGLNAGLFAFYLLGFNLRHSHIWLAYPKWLSWVLISPAQHQIHHSRARVHLDTNLGFMFSWWDRMAGTLYVPQTHEKLEYGIGQGEDEDYDSVTALYFVPFKKIATRIRKGMISMDRPRSK